ncbi:MAG: VCBS repeat-containing protein [Sphingomonas sp.]|nr:VCBS repeat-containing protein [Sphingomonas sp.]
MPSQPSGAIRMIATGTFKDAVFSPNGTILYASHAGTITAYNVSSGAVLGNWTLGTTLGGIDISTDGHTLVATERQAGPSNTVGGTTTTDYYVYGLDVTTGAKTTFTSHVTGYTNEFYDVSMLSDGQALLTHNMYSGWAPLTTLNLTSGTFTDSSDSYTQPGVLVGSADRSHLALGPENISDEPMYIYTVGSGVTASHKGYADNVMGYNDGVQAISPDGSLVAQGPGLNIYDGNLHFITSLQQKYPQFTAISGMAFSPDDHFLYLLDSTSKTVMKIETAQWNVVGQFSVQADLSSPYGAYGNTLLLSPDGHTLSVIGSAGIELINLSTIVSDGGTSGNDSITGTSYGDVLNGFGGNDTLDGGAGQDTMFGGTGDDVFKVDNMGDLVAEYSQGGNDTVYASVSGYTLPSGVETLVLTGNAQVAYGNGGNELIQGNALNNTISAGSWYGSSGSATIFGGEGNDVLNGGSGDDSLDGGNGNDYLYSGPGNDTLSGGAGNDSFAGSLTDLSGDTITDLASGDRITVNSIDYATFTYAHDGGLLKLGTSPITIGSGPVRLVVANNSSVGGVDLIAVNRMSGLTDFNGDGHSDILWRNVNGSVSTWEVTGNARGDAMRASVINGYADPSWKTIETGDFNGDGISDVLWRNQNGAVAIWHGTDSASFASDYAHGIVGTQWKIAGVGDLNADGKDDLLWHDDDGSVSAWYSTGDGFAEAAYTHAPVGTSWKIDGLADFNGDGRADILWRNDNGSLSVWTGTASGYAEASYASSSAGSDWRIAGLGDFNGDGKEDILWRHDNGSISIWSSNGPGFNQAVYNNSSVGNDWHIAMVGDFNDDGKADILWKNDNGAVSTWESNGAGFNAAVANASVTSGWSIISHEFLL